MPKTLSEEKRHQWKEKILQQQKSGQNIHRWCQENDAPYNTFLYWKDRLCISGDKPLSRSDFKELPKKINNTGITLEYRGLRIILSGDFDIDILGKCLQGLRGASC